MPGFSYDAPTSTATWTLGQSVRADKLLIELSGSIGDGDGDVFRFRINVVAGNLNGDERVDVLDLRAALLRVGGGLPTESPQAPGAAMPLAAVDVVFERLGGAGAPNPRGEIERDDRFLGSETPAFRRRLGQSLGSRLRASHRRSVSEDDDKESQYVV